MRRTTARTRVGALVVGLCGVLASSVVLPSSTQAMSVNQYAAVPAARTVTVAGHGFGHGHGMSQFGAQGAAKQGLTYRQIIGFYYPGTGWSQVTGLVRVLITSDTTTDLVVGVAPGLTLRDLGSGTTYKLPTPKGATKWRITVGAGKHSVVAYYASRWKTWRPGGRAALVGDGQFQASTPLTLYTPSGARSYRGALRSASPAPGSAARDTVNVLPMDKYVKGVIPSEMPASWQPEAVKAQAVAARTYATWSRAQYPSRYYQICDTSSCQVYGGASVEDPRSNAAVTATSRQILTYGRKPAFTQFSSSSGGWTSAGSVPYLAARSDPYDDYAGNPVHAWSTTLKAGAVERAYPSLGTLQGIRVTRRDGNGEWGGRVWALVLHGSRKDVTVSGDAFRGRFGLRSSWFSVAAR
jgi:SpoIID/LytB domain protein